MPNHRASLRPVPHVPRVGRVRHGLAVLLATVLVGVATLLALASPASARVVIVPGEVQGGTTETFAVRLANERSDVDSTWVELRFPAALPIPFVEVTPVEDWTATIESRPLDQPITVNGQEVTEAVASIRWEGGRVAPGTFQQFLVTAGPLPTEGQLVFAATQGYDDGSTEEFTDPAPSGSTAAAPTIDLVASPAVPAAPVATEPSGAPAAPAAVGGEATPPTSTNPGRGSSGGFNPLWMLLVAGLLALVALAVRQRRPAAPAEDEPVDVESPGDVGEGESLEDEASDDEPVPT